MNRSRKIQLLHKKAHGQELNISAAEKQELKKYKISAEDQRYATKANISEYVNDVDSGRCFVSFFDWCLNNHKADKRRKGSSKEEMAGANKDSAITAVILGWLPWGLAFYWMFQERMPVNACGVLGAVASIIVARISRRWGVLLLVLLPIALACFFGSL